MIYHAILLCGVWFTIVHDVTGEKLICATTDVKLLLGPNTGSAIKGILRPPYCLTHKGNAGSWARVEYKGLNMWAERGNLRLISTSGACACATGNVNVRSGAGTSYRKLTTLRRDSCLPYQGTLTRNGGYSWARVAYKGRDAYIASDKILFKQCSVDTNPSPLLPRKALFSSLSGNRRVKRTVGCPNIISRWEWGARSARNSTEMEGSQSMVFIHHTATSPCTSQTSCERIVRSIQRYHMNTRTWDDIGYSFLVGEDGNVYEGRGWNIEGAHTRGYNTRSYGISVIGDFSNRYPTTMAMSALEQLLVCAEQNNKLSSGYTVQGHRDVGTTACPGRYLYILTRRM